MNSYSRCEVLDVKHERDELSVTEIETEPQEIKGETEECIIDRSTFSVLHIVAPEDIKEETIIQESDDCQNTSVSHLVTSISTRSRVNPILGSLEKLYDDNVEKLKDDQNNTNEEENIVLSEDNNFCETNKTDYQEEKCGMEVCDDSKHNMKSSVNSNLVSAYSNPGIHPKACLKCKICSKLFTNKTHITRDVHSCVELFICNFCSNSSSENDLQHRNKNPITFNISNKLFCQKSFISSHTHTNEKQFTCNICTKSYSQKSSLKRHKRAHTIEKPSTSFTCDTCMKCFSHKHNLVEHTRTHTNEKPFTCNVCQKSFCQQGALIRHVRTHTNEKPFTCDFCMKSYSQKFHLTQHKRSHTNERPFTCNICKIPFSRKDVLIRHTRTHTNEKSS